jgi:hypothetical protein
MAQAIPYVLAAAPTILNMVGQRKQAKAEAGAAVEDAAQMRRQAMVDRAMAQREALEERRQGRLALSALMARAPSSDPGIANLAADIAGESEYRALSAMYSGETGARSREYGASQKQKQARDIVKSSRTQMLTSLVGMGSSMFQQFGGGGFSFGTVDGTNDRMFVNGGNAMDKFMRYGTGGD